MKAVSSSISRTHAGTWVSPTRRAAAVRLCPLTIW